MKLFYDSRPAQFTEMRKCVAMSLEAMITGARINRGHVEAAAISRRATLMPMTLSTTGRYR